MDQISDKSVLYHLEKAYPGHSFHSRVSGYKKGTSEDVVWLIDPLVGNRNFAAGYTQFAVSIACQVNGVVKHGIVVCPLSGEEFIASRGDGAQLNSRRIRVSDKHEFTNALISLNPEHLNTTSIAGFQSMLIDSGAQPRITGCTALDILYCASNRVLGGWASSVDTTSLAAANLILHEAGGLMGSESGNPDYTKGKELIFANPKFFKTLLKARRDLPSAEV
jgi:myo-inositol-1(or 4)-monophosphatase